MVPNPVPTWWQEQHALLCEVAEDESEAWADAGPPFSAALLQVLTEVEDAFARTGADTPGWEDPHLTADGELLDSREEEYSRCLEPGKYRILWARAEAWTRVLTARGWADAADADGDAGTVWATAPYVDRYRTTVLRPHRAGAQPLVLARTAPDEATGSTDLTGRDALITGLVLGLGEPAVPVSTTPDCGCDACDSGSHDLLDELDRTILSIVDGSFEIVLTPAWSSHRTSFGAGGGSGEEDPGLDVTVTAQPWAEGWTPRPLCPAIEPPRRSPVSAPRSRRPRRSTAR